MDPSMMKQGFGTIAGYNPLVGATANMANKPRELGVAERMQGIVSGLSRLNYHLEMVRDRIDGPSPKAGQTSDTTPPPVPGLVISLSEAEANLRQALASVDALLSTL